jgi:hypothetical protein
MWDFVLLDEKAISRELRGLLPTGLLPSYGSACPSAVNKLSCCWSYCFTLSGRGA